MQSRQDHADVLDRLAANQTTLSYVRRGVDEVRESVDTTVVE